MSNMFFVRHLKKYKQMKIFNIEKPVIGMIHVGALPDTPNYRGDFNFVINKAVEESFIYRENEIDIIAIEK